MPVVLRAAAESLAWYVSAHAAVLAPRGWHCFDVYGSDGHWLFVAPQRLTADQLDVDRRGFRGAVVMFGYSYGGTSGRWTVAERIGRYFPRHRGFIRDLRERDPVPHDYPTAPYSGDRILSRTATRIRILTPAGVRGQGSDFLARSTLPTESLIMLDPDNEMSAATISVRLPRAQVGLSPAIFAGVRRATASR
jgi:hypothetical protein